MKSQKEIILLTTGLFSFAIFTIVLVIAHQAEQLQHEQHKVVESAYLATKQKELKNYLSLAKLAIAHLHITESSPVDINAQQEARNILRKLKFDGDDGYYFIHDFDCKNILQPPDPNREGQYECDRRDSSGKFHIKELIDIAKKEGEGFVHYDVIKPSTEKITHKLSYVVSIPEWRWVLGTGIYTDDINIPLEHVHKEVSEIIASIMRWIAFIATLSISVVGYLQWRTEVAPLTCTT
ncbi:MAG: cache domain-containing protein [Nitrosomonas sp.]|nr:cache domain-containing protein [Nitrosomonas sp.]